MSWTHFADMPFSTGAPFVLNSNGITLAAGFRITMGDGTVSPIGITTNGLRIFSASNQPHNITSLATAARTIQLADFDGVLIPERLAVCPATHSNSSNTVATQVPSFEIPAANLLAGTYEIEIALLCQSALGTTAVRPSLTGPAGNLQWLSLEWWNAQNAGANTATNWTRQHVTAFGARYNATDPVDANIPFITRGYGMFRLATNASSAIGIDLLSEINASQVQILAGSTMRLRRIS